MNTLGYLLVAVSLFLGSAAVIASGKALSNATERAFASAGMYVSPE